MEPPPPDRVRCRLLVTTALPSLYDHPDPDTGAPVHQQLGRLLTPRHVNSVAATAEAGIPWACDNDGYNGIDEPKLRAMLAHVTGAPGCKFIAVPDVLRCAICHLTVDGYGDGGACRCGDDRVFVYGDAELTARRFEDWQPFIEETGQPLALVLQDGQDEVGVCWDAIDAVFVGGSDSFKLGPSAAEWCRQAKARGKWVHWGRVNSKKRMTHCVGTGACDSLDGTKWVRWRTTHLDNGLRWLREVSIEQRARDRQLAMAA